MKGDVLFAGTHQGVDIEIVAAEIPKRSDKMLLSCRAMVSLNHAAFDNPEVAFIDIGHMVRGGPWIFDIVDGSRVGQWIEFTYETGLVEAIREVCLLVDALEVMQLRAEEQIRHAARKHMKGTE